MSRGARSIDTHLNVSSHSSHTPSEVSRAPAAFTPDSYLEQHIRAKRALQDQRRDNSPHHKRSPHSTAEYGTAADATIKGGTGADALSDRHQRLMARISRDTPLSQSDSRGEREHQHGHSSPPQSMPVARAGVADASPPAPNRPRFTIGGTSPGSASAEVARDTRDGAVRSAQLRSRLRRIQTDIGSALDQWHALTSHARMGRPPRSSSRAGDGASPSSSLSVRNPVVLGTVEDVRRALGDPALSDFLSAQSAITSLEDELNENVAEKLKLEDINQQIEVRIDQTRSKRNGSQKLLFELQRQRKILRKALHAHSDGNGEGEVHADGDEDQSSDSLSDSADAQEERMLRRQRQREHQKLLQQLEQRTDAVEALEAAAEEAEQRRHAESVDLHNTMRVIDDLRRQVGAQEEEQQTLSSQLKRHAMVLYAQKDAESGKKTARSSVNDSVLSIVSASTAGGGGNTDPRRQAPDTTTSTDGVRRALNFDSTTAAAPAVKIPHNGALSPNGSPTTAQLSGDIIDYMLREHVKDLREIHEKLLGVAPTAASTRQAEHQADSNKAVTMKIHAHNSPPQLQNANHPPIGELQQQHDSSTTPPPQSKADLTTSGPSSSGGTPSTMQRAPVSFPTTDRVPSLPLTARIHPRQPSTTLNDSRSSQDTENSVMARANGVLQRYKDAASATADTRARIDELLGRSQEKSSRPQTPSK